MKFRYTEGQYYFKRYPETRNRSLRAWSAADEYVLQYLDGTDINLASIAICNDRFGFLTCNLHEFSPVSVINNRSQHKAYTHNHRLNNLDVDISRVVDPLAKIPESIEIGIVNIPKSLELFRLYLYQLSQNMSKTSKVICSFMTRNFSPQMLSIAGEFFEEVEQSRAWKKSRLMILSGVKPYREIELLNTVNYSDSKVFHQYFGVFSAANIDYASQFLIEHLELKDSDCCVLDLASGNGILAWAVKQANHDCKLHLLDDSWLAVESSKLNIKDDNTIFHWDNCLEEFQSEFFDLIVSNPPFHFEFEIDMNVAVGLFSEVKRCLRSNGHFQLVANRHLNYKIHLEKIFDQVNVLAENKKFVVYDCC